MSYELTELLQRCTHEDAEFIIANIDSFINFTDDKGLKVMLGQWTTGAMPLLLAQKIEKELRYLGSSDVAYAARKLRGLDPAGVPVDEMLDDISKVLKIKLKRVGTLEGKLEALAKGVVEKTFFNKSPEEQISILRKANFEEEKIKIIEDYINNKGVKIILPVLMQLLGPKAAMQIFETVLLSVIAMFIGKTAAQQLLKLIMTKCPWLVALGPVAVIGLTGWTALDLCGPAMRKTIPILLHLSIVALRDGAEEESFWTENSNDE